MLSARRAVLVALAGASLAAIAACDGDPGTSASTTTGGAGGAGGCPAPAEPMLLLTIAADDGPLPPDTRLSVTWSAGKEPTFALDDPSTWHTLDDGSNVVCDAKAGAMPPTALTCELWTSGATEIVIQAGGYATIDETVSPTVSDTCGPVPTKVSVLLQRADAGTD